MKYAFDLHKTIDRHPEFFRGIMLSLQKDIDNEHSVYVISGPPIVKIEHDLRDFGIFKDEHYSKIFSIVDYLLENDYDMYQDEKGNYWSNDNDAWNSAKSNICDDNDIDFLIDDKEVYGRYFQNHRTKFILFRY